MKSFFNPKSIAIIGVSKNKNKPGRVIFNNLRKNKKLDLYPINPKYKRLGGHKCYGSIKNLNQKLDLVIISIPKQFVLAEIKNIIKLKIKNIVIISAGFTEVNAADSDSRQIKELIKENRLNLLGPNSLGYINNHNNINASFYDHYSKKKESGLAIISQSGSIIVALESMVKKFDQDISYAISLGNKYGINENDCIQYLAKQSEVSAFILYLESFSDGNELIKIAKKINKPIILIKGGNTRQGSTAAESHTSAVSSESRVYKYLIGKSNLFEVETIHQAAQLSLFLKNRNLEDFSKNKWQIITNAGGLGIVATDILSNSGIVFNSKPVDVLGDASIYDYQKEYYKISKKDNLNILLIHTNQGKTSRKQIKDFYKKEFNPNLYLITEELDYSDVSTLDDLKFLSEKLKIAKTESKAKNTTSEGAKLIDLSTSIKLLKKIKVWDSKIQTVDNFDQINAKKLLFPASLKAYYPQLIHRSEFGLIKVNIRDIHSLSTALNTMKSAISNKYLSTTQYIISPMYKNKLELFTGVKKDPAFGWVLSFGLGGIYVNTINEPTFAALPASKKDIKEMIEDNQQFMNINGKRGVEAIELKELTTYLHQLSKLPEFTDQVSQFEFNPIIWTGKDLMLADFKLFE